ncbi:hypothetical protein K438DRAFT_1771045 [Mycena galopus ATCC 62051]|nr:hypothetical protein K438DRAFT_1771045 [Mycena galopus ATCC 62051]
MYHPGPTNDAEPLPVHHLFRLAADDQLNAAAIMAHHGLDLEAREHFSNRWSQQWARAGGRKMKGTKETRKDASESQKILYLCECGMSIIVINQRNDTLLSPLWAVLPTRKLHICLGPKKSFGCKDAVMSRFPPMPVHPSVFAVALAQLRDGATFSDVKKKNIGLVAAPNHKGFPAPNQTSPSLCSRASGSTPEIRPRRRWRTLSTPLGASRLTSVATFFAARGGGEGGEHIDRNDQAYALEMKISNIDPPPAPADSELPTVRAAAAIKDLLANSDLYHVEPDSTEEDASHVSDNESVATDASSDEDEPEHVFETPTASNTQRALNDQALARASFELEEVGPKFGDIAEFLRNTKGPCPRARAKYWENDLNLSGPFLRRLTASASILRGRHCPPRSLLPPLPHSGCQLNPQSESLTY